MASTKRKKVLISGASVAGLSMACQLNSAGYQVTVVELAETPRAGGTAIDFHGAAIDVVKHMGIFEQLTSNALHLEKIEFKNSDDVTVNAMLPERNGGEIEIERTAFINILFHKIKNDVEFIFGDSICALTETPADITAIFRNSSARSFDLVIGCDGSHSNVRKIWFGEEATYAHFMGAYFSISIVNKSLIRPNIMQFYNVPGKAYMLNAYKDKTDVIFSFHAEKEIPYDYRDFAQQKKIILGQFAGQGWRTEELLKEIMYSENFYFDKFCQIKMPSWTKGRVALTGDAAYCASPAAGLGGSLAVQGAAALAEALEKHGENHETAFAAYNKNFRPFIEAVQAEAEWTIREHLIPMTAEAISKRNEGGF